MAVSVKALVVARVEVAVLSRRPWVRNTSPVLVGGSWCPIHVEVRIEL